MTDDYTCANCGWPADNCSLCYDFRGRLALPLSDTAEAVIRPGCQLCYKLQILGRSDLAAELAKRKGILRNVAMMLEIDMSRLDVEIRKIH